MTRNFVRFTFLSLAIVFQLGCASTNNEKQNWNQTIKQVSNGVVSIQTDVPISFDGKWNTSSYATGFIVDSQKGIILTNRHVVTPGPVTAKAILINNEEIDLTPLYIDPIHDFGFFKYNPDDIKHLDPHEFKLDPASAHVGQEIRIIGNDAGQKVAILDGTISRLDRDAPLYGSGRYNDFNTFYIQASTASTGGSSGSPVININGNVVALNAGSKTRSANAFYLPLETVAAALEKVQQDQAIVRGGLLTTFKSTTYAELQRLGLTAEIEQDYRQSFPELKGLLTVEAILPGSSADEQLQIGDILLSINQQKVAEFLALETLLNNNVGESLSLRLLRQGEIVNRQVSVSDLADVTPNALLKFDSSVFHNLSYQQARHMDKAINGVYVANASSSFKAAGIPHHSVITEFNGQSVKDLAHFNQLLSQVPNEEKVHVRYYTQGAPKISKYALLEISRKWFEQSFCQSNPELGYWQCQIEQNGQDSATPVQVANDLKALPVPNHTGLENALVKVSYISPYSILGRSGNKHAYGTGLIVDKEKGWVVIDRSIVQSVLGDVKLVFNNQLEIPGKVEYIHPLHNLALVSYPPEALGQLPVAEATFATSPLKRDDNVLQMGLNYDGEIEYRATQIDSIQELWIAPFNVPQFAESNLQVVHLVNPNASVDGVLINEQGQIAALWSTFSQGGENGKGSQYFSAGMKVDYVQELIELAQSRAPLYSLNVNLTQIAPVKALQRGLPHEWLTKILQGDTVNNKVFMIFQVMADTPSADMFKRGDILLAINDQPVSSYQAFERLSQQRELKVTYFRQGEVLEANLNTTSLSGQDINRVLFWAGLSLHAPHRAARMQRNIGSEGVYIASYNYGSPATRYNVYAMRRIVEVDGKKTSSLDDFIAQVKDKRHGESVLLKTMDFNNKEDVVSLKLDTHYWPFFEVKLEDGKWQRVLH